MNELVLFAGGGGGVLGTKHLLGWKQVCYVEINSYCQEILKARIRDGLFDDAPIWDDVRTFDGTPWRGAVDIVSAGFPCQPFSTAGKRLGKDDPRNLWPDTLRVIDEVRPQRCLLENTPALRCPDRSGDETQEAYYGKILRDLAEIGYCIPWDCLPASAFGAYHQRDRLWIVADAVGDKGTPEGGGASKGRPVLAEPYCDVAADSNGLKTRPIAEVFQAGQCERSGAVTADTNSVGYRPSNNSVRPGRAATEHGAWWASEPRLERVVYGVADRVADRVDERGYILGNGQVPICAAAAFLLLAGGKPCGASAVVAKAWEMLSS